MTEDQKIWNDVRTAAIGLEKALDVAGAAGLSIIVHDVKPSMFSLLGQTGGWNVPITLSRVLK